MLSLFLKWDSWRIWRPDVMLMTLVLALLYFVFTNTRRNNSRVIHEESTTMLQLNWKLRLRFLLGLLVLYGVMGPVAFLGEQYSFTVYVIQMLLSTMVLPWLLVFSMPSPFFELILTPSWIRRTVYLCTRPIVAMVLFNAFVTATLLPSVLTTVLSLNWLHVFVQFSMLVTAIFFWWPIAQPVNHFPSLKRGQMILYIVYSMNFMMPIIVMELTSDHPWYQTLAVGAYTIGLSPLADQQIGGVLMLVTMYLVYGILGTRLYTRQNQSIWYE